MIYNLMAQDIIHHKSQQIKSSFSMVFCHLAPIKTCGKQETNILKYFLYFQDRKLQKKVKNKRKREAKWQEKQLIAADREGNLPGQLGRVLITILNKI